MTQQTIISSPPSKSESENLIDVYTDDVILDVGASRFSLGKLILKHYKVPYSLLLVGTPDCPYCSRMAYTLNETIGKVKGNSHGATPFFAYSLILTRMDPRAMGIQTGLEVSLFPALFVVDGRGDLTPLIPQYMEYLENDPMGNGRLQDIDDVLNLMVRIQSQDKRKNIRQLE